MGGKEYTVLRIGHSVARPLVELFEGMHLAVPERVFRLVIGFGDDQRQVLFQENGGPKQLVAVPDTFAGQWHDVVFDCLEQAGDQLGISGSCSNRVRAFRR